MCVRKKMCALKKKCLIPKGNFVRRVLSQELNSRQIEQKIQDVKEKIEKMEEKMDQVLILLRKTNFGDKLKC